MKEHQSLVTLKDVWVDTGDILGTTSLIGTGNRDILVTVVITKFINILDTRVQKNTTSAAWTFRTFLTKVHF